MTESLQSPTRTEMPPLPGVSIVSTPPASVTVTVFGEVDTFGSPVLDAALDVVWAEAPRNLVVDLTNVTFLGVTGLHALLRARRTAQQRVTHLILRPGSPYMERILELVGASDVTCAGIRPGAAAADPPRTALTGSGRPRGALAPAPADVAAPGSDLAERPWRDAALSDDPLLRTARVGAAWFSSDSLQSTLESVCATALATIPGTEGAAIVLADGEHGEMHAGTDSRARALDVVRERLRQPRGSDRNPDPAWIDGALVVDELGQDPRWPQLAAKAGELRVRSVLCLSIGATRPLGALTMYSSRPRAFDEEAVRHGRVLATVAAIALSAAVRQQRLARALTARTVIDQAVGVLMERHELTADQAFDLLGRTSAVTKAELAVLAAQVVETGEL